MHPQQIDFFLLSLLSMYVCLLLPESLRESQPTHHTLSLCPPAPFLLVCLPWVVPALPACCGICTHRRIIVIIAKLQIISSGGPTRKTQRRHRRRQIQLVNLWPVTCIEKPCGSPLPPYPLLRSIHLFSILLRHKTLFAKSRHFLNITTKSPPKTTVP